MLLVLLPSCDPVGPDAPKPIDRAAAGSAAPELPPGVDGVPAALERPTAPRRPTGPEAAPLKPIDRTAVGSTAPELPPGLEPPAPKSAPAPAPSAPAPAGPATQGPIDGLTRVRFTVESAGKLAVLIDGTRGQANVRCPGGAQSDVRPQTADQLLTALEGAPPAKRSEADAQVALGWALQCPCDAGRCDCLPAELSKALAAACGSVDFKPAPRIGPLKLTLKVVGPATTDTFTLEGDAKRAAGTVLRTSRRGSWVGRAGPLPPKALATFFKALEAQRWHVLPSVGASERQASSVVLTLARGGVEHTFSVSGGCPCPDGTARCACPSKSLAEAAQALVLQTPVTRSHVVVLTRADPKVLLTKAPPAQCEELDGPLLCAAAGALLACVPTEQVHRFECFDPFLDESAALEDLKVKAGKLKRPTTLAVSDASAAPCLLSGRLKFACPSGRVLQRLRKSGQAWLADDEKNREVQLEAVWQVP